MSSYIVLALSVAAAAISVLIAHVPVSKLDRRLALLETQAIRIAQLLCQEIEQRQRQGK